MYSECMTAEVKNRFSTCVSRWKGKKEYVESVVLDLSSLIYVRDEKSSQNL